jgi:hypothetical protein
VPPVPARVSNRCGNRRTRSFYISSAASSTSTSPTTRRKASDHLANSELNDEVGVVVPHLEWLAVGRPESMTLICDAQKLNLVSACQ